MKATWVRSGALAVAVLTSAPALYAQGTQGQTGSGQAQTQPREQGSQQDHREFVSQMLMANMTEVELGKIALDRASNPEVKKFAQMMIADHSKSNKELQPIAQQLGVQMPTELGAKERSLADRLSKLQGAEFDREYMSAMVDDHQQDIGEVKPVARRSTGTASEATGTSGTKGTAGTAGMEQRVQQYAAKTMPILQKHLDHAQKIEKSLEKK